MSLVSIIHFKYLIGIFNTKVTANALAEFQPAFSNTIKGNMDGLKKQKKSKGKRKPKAMATQ